MPDFSIVWPAVKHGLKVWHLCEVTSIRRLPDAGEADMPYEDHYQGHRNGQACPLLHTGPGESISSKCSA